jgi:hypothetical protein
VDVFRADVVSVIDDLLSGSMSREAASSWAAERHTAASTDPAVDEALDALALIDARHVSAQGEPMHYMYDFAEVSQARDSLLG